MNNKHFPRNPGAVTDDEICSLIVALSRTRKRCHVISFRFFGAGGLAPSVFLGWINQHLETVTVNKDYDLDRGVRRTRAAVPLRGLLSGSGSCA
jgi:hypothetical protein